jgi:hypothetical protein
MYFSFSYYFFLFMSIYSPKPPLLKRKDMLYRRDQYITVWLFVSFALQVWTEVRIITLPSSSDIWGNEYWRFLLYGCRPHALTATTPNINAMTEIRTLSFGCVICLSIYLIYLCLPICISTCLPVCLSILIQWRYQQFKLFSVEWQD